MRPQPSHLSRRVRFRGPMWPVLEICSRYRLHLPGLVCAGASLPYRLQDPSNAIAANPCRGEEGLERSAPKNRHRERCVGPSVSMEGSATPCVGGAREEGGGAGWGGVKGSRDEGRGGNVCYRVPLSSISEHSTVPSRAWIAPSSPLFPAIIILALPTTEPKSVQSVQSDRSRRIFPYLALPPSPYLRYPWL